MLISLYIKDFGLVESAELVFGPGLNVLTGETGAGKSIIVEALKMSLGGRAQADLIRTGRERALVQSTFDVSRAEQVRSALQEFGLDEGDEENDVLVMSRELSRQGRNICRINGRIVNLGVFRGIAGLLVDMHGQHEQQALLVPEKQMYLLDRYGDPQLLDLLAQTGRAYREWQRSSRRREEIVAGSRERQQRMDMIKYQMEEIDAAGLSGMQEEELYRQRDRLANAEKIKMLAEQVVNRIYKGMGQCPAAVDLLGASQNDLRELRRYVPEAGRWLENIYSAQCLLEESARELASYRESVEVDPRELDYVEERLARLERLKRKYADSLAEILAYREKIAGELEQLQQVETDAGGIDDLVREKRRQYEQLALKLGALRVEAARLLEKEVEGELRGLEMNNVQFTVQVSDGEPSAAGSNKVEFLISPNPGEPLRPLAKIASGGELSRVMLALKTILAAGDEIATLVFDEIDAGIGGRTLQAIAEKLARIAGERQVICVTHAAAIAACATTHYLVKKSTRGQKTFISVHKVEGEKRVAELSRMLGGSSDSATLVNYVRKLIK